MERLDRRRLLALTFTALLFFSSAMLIALLVQPINSGLVRSAVGVFLVLSLASASALFWQRRGIQ